tara:strand:- start:24950 stop:26593 length:1644 start_codon:yes stop_codon:yes gene_type:complete
MVEQQNILILDDNLLFRMITKNILLERGYLVLEGSNGKEGLDLIQQHKPDLVITDVLMPIMDGYEFLRNIRLSSTYPHLKVIFYTGTYSGYEEIALAKSGGVSAVLIKPAEPDEILNAVTAALSSVSGTNSEIGPRYEREHLRILTNQLSKKVLELEQFNHQLSKEIQNRIRAEHEALQSKSFFKALLDSIPQLAWKMDQEGCIEYGNRRFTDFTSISTGPINLDSLSRFIHPDDKPEVMKTIEWAFSKNVSFQCETRLKRAADNVYIHHLISAVFIPGLVVNDASWFTTATDISDQKRSESTLRLLKEESESLSRSKTEFLNNVSHELRTPLTAILGFSEILLSECQSEQTLYLSRIRENAKRLADILADIMSISEAEMTDKSTLKDALDVDQFFENIAIFFKPKAARKGLNLVLSYENGFPNSVYTFVSQAEKILMHLLDNAIKFTTTGLVKMRAFSEPDLKSGSKGKIIFEVEDTGIGIDSEKTNSLYQIFGQIDGSLTRSQGGLGLGLIVSKKLAQSIGGQLELVRSQPGKGSCFRLSIPIVN